MSGTDDVIWLTYDALSVRLGITPESCRNLVRRRRWARQDGNDGARRIGVPREYLDDRDNPAPVSGPTDGDMDLPTDGGINPPHDGAMTMALAALERHLSRLEDDLTQARAQITDLALERDEARAALKQVDVLRAQLDAERARASAAELDRDRWHTEAQQDQAARAINADKVRAELIAWKAQPWWRRALG